MVLKTLFLLLCAAVPIALGAGDTPAADGKKADPPARVGNGVKESALTTITLQPKAEARLGIKTAPVKLEKVQQTRVYGGEVMVPKGRTITVSAPITGTVTALPSAGFPAPGSRVTQGQPMVRLLAALISEREVLTASERISLEKMRADLETARVQATGEEAVAKVQQDAARVALDRARHLHKQDIGSVKAVDEAQAELELAAARQKAAGAQSEMLASMIADLEKGKPSALTILSPLNGVIQDVQVSESQAVASAAPLFQIVGDSPLWIRVPVYVGDLQRIDPQAVARIRGLADPAGAPSRVAKPVVAPPSGNPNAATVDLFFEIDNADGSLRPGERLTAIVPLGETRESRTVAWSAVLHDIHGGTWVYENTQPHVFVRRRVAVLRVIAGQAILARGPAVGSSVVITGAAELFGIEFGVGK
ncbi:MAG: efflux RND transporter periplasmic adaptor subunit [Phycisphaerae bacterium]|nr:efflux RND transporter periplasmic adaptor subunit [Phycisphaerae bacterium]